MKADSSTMSGGPKGTVLSQGGIDLEPDWLVVAAGTG